MIKRIARAAGLLIVRRHHVGARFIEHVPRTVFDLILLKTFPSLRGLTFIQVGANDGQRVDPLQRYIDEERWSGLLLEPMAANFEALRRRHGDNPALRLCRMAVDQSSGRRRMYDIDREQYPNLPEWAYGLASFERARVLQAALRLGLPERAVTAEEVETIDWVSVFAEFGSTSCDVLVLDTEGHDLLLLRGAKLSDRRPRIVHFEHEHVPATERIAFYSELLDLGYEIATDGPDTTAWLPR